MRKYRKAQEENEKLIICLIPEKPLLTLSLFVYHSIPHSQPQAYIFTSYKIRIMVYVYLVNYSFLLIACHEMFFSIKYSPTTSLIMVAVSHTIVYSSILY